MNEKVYEKAIRFLSMRLHTTGELHQKLRRKGFDDEVIIPVLKRLEELDFLNDQRFAEIFIDNLKRFKDWGYFGIRSKLAARQIPHQLAVKAMAEFFTAADELAVAKKLFSKINPAPSCRGIAPRRKAILSHSSPQQAAGYSGRCWIKKRPVTREKLLRAFSSRGFRTEVIREILREET
ncbi:MAG: hypothetical protein A3C85_02130 [Candidatus Doudnabacteria bacterium RIFCSPHIGHO2_02_FULL_48_21]|nr:MAG: hypothetical protein A3K05_02420 [Candidatus Doudnabacteria bacterium RIFCSPHIGHO2_01_48_18]OGE93424.1 MAG: hypothetical protein A3C85_02130 [Candidatus Doudnabacteria bacterium RIFCSPHIGHO2_02_FULL_48_21]OGE97829.1 MAG: hypothetical protein A3A83_03690 [Candidatus Doudnabacteria bacterium RIFCSPLOWO2_01_FULL_48_57]OGF02150.1 MAG: hypothetical protein A3G07_00860 [Candidatus Doudnabacteria bacterium RIFCSPLOWO2_12_FULL_47_12]